jgi:DNA mismatch endonuclease, patch repair protein
LKKYQENIIKVPRFHEDNGFYTTAERSKMMSRIKDRNTTSEKKLRHALWDMGLRYRKNVKKLPGKPDIVLKKYKLVIFVDGEFWHGFNWEEKKHCIKSNHGFWIPKIERNMQRDIEVTNELTQKGWEVIRFWEQDIQKNFGACVYRICDYIHTFKLTQ